MAEGRKLSKIGGYLIGFVIASNNLRVTCQPRGRTPHHERRRSRWFSPVENGGITFERKATMNVRDVMKTVAARCTAGINLGAAVEILWNRNCGILPVVDEHERVVSVITERDICIALGTRNRLPGEITVGEVATHRVICCSPADDVRSALAKMLEARVRRLPVVNAEGKLEGVLAMDDVVEPILLKNTVRDGRTSEEAASTLRKPLRADSTERQQGRSRPDASLKS
jgi:CBS domain-containing protein